MPSLSRILRHAQAQLPRLGEMSFSALTRPAQRRLLLVLVVLPLLALLFVGAALWAARQIPQPAPQGRVASGPVTSAVEAPLADVADDHDGDPDGDDDDVEPSPASAPPVARVPPLLSDNTDLSYARRAGLHRAPNPLRLTASVALAVDAQTGAVLYARNAQATLPIASLTKLLTAMVVLDSGVPLSQRVTIAAADVDRLRHSRSRLRVGASLTRAEALRLALMSSENRAAHALARTAPGGMAAFVAAMNAKARQLGLVGSSFVDPTGLSNGNRATGRDVATLLAAALRYPLIRSMSTTPSRQVRIGKQRLRYLNSNRLVRVARWPIQLQKTGYIVEAGQCLAMVVRVANRPVIMVLLDAGSVGHRGSDAGKLRRWVDRNGAAARGAAASAPAARSPGGS